MIGVFDSGLGGENALRHIRALAPTADVTILLDRENAPYGTKCREEIRALCEAGISRLVDAGCERVLIACCTASTVHAELSPDTGRVSLPIIEPTAREALARSRSRRVAVIATDATVASHAFRSALGGASVAEIAASPLVGEIERGARDGAVGESLGRYLDRLLRPIAASGADTLILGCTHFVCIKGEIEARLQKFTKKKIKTVDSSEVGARGILRICGASARGRGLTVRL